MLDKKKGTEKKMTLEISFSFLKTKCAQNTEKKNPWANRNERQCLTGHSCKIRSLKSLSP